jgi:uncharacterized membrane protein
LELLALAAWTGGLIIIVASVIPAVFNSFGMEPGGRFLTRVFDGYNRAIVVSTVILILCTSLRQWWAYRTSGGRGVSRLEMALLVIMVFIATLIITVLGPQTVAFQEQAFSMHDELAKKAAYDAFFRVHMIVRALYLVNLGLGIALIAIKVKTWTGTDFSRSGGQAYRTN